MPHYYLNEAQANNEWTLPTLWVTKFTTDELQEYFNSQTEWTGYEPENAEGTTARFMACICVPGCLPDSDWSGPFETEEEAEKYMKDMCAE
jgi:hypothetical protein